MDYAADGWKNHPKISRSRNSLSVRERAGGYEEIGCRRFRPEEVAAAGTVNANEWPLGFPKAEARGVAIVTELFRRATPVA